MNLTIKRKVSPEWVHLECVLREVVYPVCELRAEICFFYYILAKKRKIRSKLISLYVVCNRWRKNPLKDDKIIIKNGSRLYTCLKRGSA